MTIQRIEERGYGEDTPADKDKRRSEGVEKLEQVVLTKPPIQTDDNHKP
jgi:hypothetical protein